ncbi:MAG: DUF1385 domain-containing protein [Deltaproteobacteria bacterium]|nr:DUF1385 domain-containing protein [Candidatus Zymogenaceae bacterium]
MDKIRVGGQAVIEGVMMRAPKSLTVAVRKSDGSIKVKEDPVNSIAETFPVLKKPLFRGVVILFESLVHGMTALTYSANEAAEEEDGDGDISPWMMALTIVFSLAFGVFLFVVLPHLATAYMDRIIPLEIGIESFWFHLIDGVIKVMIFVIYLMVISLMPDIRRVFMYHGAEHKSIFAYEAGEELTVDNARKYTTKHPRCGTSFILIVLLVSIVMFAVIFPLMPELQNLSKLVKNLIYVLIKIPLLIPIAGISYEMIRLAGEKRDNRLLQAMSLPGVWLQRITTREPSDDQLEVALAALSTALLMEERQNGTGAAPSCTDGTDHVQ